ncbi:MAG: ferric reductase-like transmembrane domain-containing protein [Candidatus Staskawiczbacteria bacterium]|nr:ferric reductase-like transmembrane domain-containing protein [Candidatus Staskawiczbacteria bacterium]
MKNKLLQSSGWPASSALPARQPDGSHGGGRSNAGWWIIVILSLVPVLFIKPVFTPNGLGRILGLTGFAMFALVLILSARLKIFEIFFKGINDSYTAHHFFGGLSFCLILFHPLLLSANYLIASPRTAILFFLPSSNLAQNLGIFGLFLMILTLAITFYAKIKYQAWKFTHKFMGVAFILVFFHVFLIGSDVGSNYALKTYFLILGALAIVSYLYRVLLADYFILPKTFRYAVKRVKAMPDKIWEVEFTAKNSPLNFKPGQFAFIRIHSKAVSKEAHPFTFSSSSGENLKIAIKELGDYTNNIGKLKPGDLVEIEGPFGAFCFRDFPSKNQIWIAGGVGIAPFLSMLRSLTEQDSNFIIHLFFSVKEKSLFSFREEILSIAKKNKNLHVVFWDSSSMGFITANAVRKNVPNTNSCDILICGPTAMMQSLNSQFLKHGLNKKQIHTEEFTLY